MGWFTAPDRRPPGLGASPGGSAATAQAEQAAAARAKALLSTLQAPAETPLYNTVLELESVLDNTSVSQLRTDFFAIKDAENIDPHLLGYARSIIVSRLASLDLNAAFNLGREAAEDRF